MRAAILFGIIFISINSYSAVWKTTQSWSESWELRYQKWVSENWSHEFFAKPHTPFSGLILDCADTVYSMRIIFAYENSLPIVFKDPTGGKLNITNDMNRWDGLPENQRIRKFLQYIYEFFGTGSIPQNSYPVAINRQSVTPGTILYADKHIKHSWTVQNINEYGVLHLVFSTMPARNLINYNEGLPPVSYLFPNGLDVKGYGGFRAFRTPDEIGIPEFKIKKFSTEQYLEIPEKTWATQVQSRLALIKESNTQRLERLLGAACQASKDRAEIVNAAIEFLEHFNGKCLDSENIENYSTPSRDKRLVMYFFELEQAFREINTEQPSSISGDLYEKVSSIVDKYDSEITDKTYCPISISNDRQMTLGLIYLRVLTKQASSNPHDPFEVRWGDVTTPSPRAQFCSNP